MMQLTSACDIFDNYATTFALNEDDCAEFLVLVQDVSHPVDGMMAVSGLTLSMLEDGWNEGRMKLLLKAYLESPVEEIRERSLVGLLLVMLMHNAMLRECQHLWEPIQEVLTSDAELSFTALCNIARTAQVKKLELFNQQLAKDIMPLMDKVGSDEFYEVIRKHQTDMERIARMHLDQNFLIFKSAYQTPFFQQRAAHWFLPWNDEHLLSIAEEERQQVQDMLSVWQMCDSDKYAFLGMSNMIRNTMKGQLQSDLLGQMGESLGHMNIVTNGYVQQLYRFFRLSSFARVLPFDLVNYMRHTLAFRWIVVGERARAAIGQFLS